MSSLSNQQQQNDSTTEGYLTGLSDTTASAFMFGRTNSGRLSVIPVLTWYSDSEPDLENEDFPRLDVPQQQESATQDLLAIPTTFPEAWAFERTDSGRLGASDRLDWYEEVVSELEAQESLQLEVPQRQENASGRLLTIPTTLSTAWTFELNEISESSQEDLLPLCVADSRSDCCSDYSSDYDADSELSDLEDYADSKLEGLEDLEMPICIWTA
jgi:hypothetical protein